MDREEERYFVIVAYIRAGLIRAQALNLALSRYIIPIYRFFFKGISNITSVSQINPNVSVISQCDCASSSSSTSSMSNKSISNAALVSKSSHSYQSSKLPSSSGGIVSNSSSMLQQSQLPTLTVPQDSSLSLSSSTSTGDDSKEKRKLGFGFNNKTRAIPTATAPQPSDISTIMKSNKTVIQVGPIDQVASAKQSDPTKSIK